MVNMPYKVTEDQEALRAAVRDLCKGYPDAYWRDVDERHEYPVAFVDELTKAGYLAALIPAEFGGAGLGITDASLILEEINRSGANSSACHAQMYIMGTLLRHGNAEQKRMYLPKIATGELRLQSFGVTEPNTGSDTTKLQTSAVRKGERYIVNGQKIFISRVQHSDLLLLLCRTTPLDQIKKRTEGLSVLLVDMRTAGPALEVRPLKTMINHETNQLFFENLEVPAVNLIGKEGEGFKYILDGMNAERILIAAESVGDGRWFIERAVNYSKTRVVFDRPIGANQGVQFPIARAHMAVEAADLMRMKAAALFDAGQPCGAEANMAKFLCAEAAWQAANACMDAFGGYGFCNEYDVERKFRETRLFMAAPIAQNLVLAFVGQHVLGMPRSY
jgi:acyl-CoA dehydrogenase